jgi:hypothetical protein
LDKGRLVRRLWGDTGSFFEKLLFEIDSPEHRGHLRQKRPFFARTYALPGEPVLFYG